MLRTALTLGIQSIPLDKEDETASSSNQSSPNQSQQQEKTDDDSNDSSDLDVKKDNESLQKETTNVPNYVPAVIKRRRFAVD